MPGIGFSAKLPPKKAIEYFQKKGNAPSWNWYDTWQDAHTKAFVVAKVTKLDILKDIRNAVDNSIKNGTTFREFQKNLTPILQKKGWWGRPEIGGKKVQLGSPWRLKTIYQTNLSVAYAAGRWKSMEENSAMRPWWQYKTMGDSRVRDEHRILNNKIFKFDDPFWKSFYPPNGWRCRCYVVALNNRDLEKENLTPSDSEGLISKENQPVSPGSDIQKPVSVYTDPVTGEKISPQPGWSYNPGESSSSWKPDLNKYPEDLMIRFKEDGYELNPDEQKKVEDHIKTLKETFKDWQGWDISKAKFFYDLTDEEFYKILNKDKSSSTLGFRRGNNIYIRTDVTLNLLGIASRENQVRAFTTFAHEPAHIARKSKLKDWRIENTKKEKDRIRKIEEGTAALIARIWGVEYGGIRPEELIKGTRQEEILSLLINLIERNEVEENVKEKVRTNLFNTRNASGEEMKDWARGIEYKDFRGFLPLLKKSGIIKEANNFKEAERELMLWILEKK